MNEYSHGEETRSGSGLGWAAFAFVRRLADKWAALSRVAQLAVIVVIALLLLLAGMLGILGPV